MQEQDLMKTYSVFEVDHKQKDIPEIEKDDFLVELAKQFYVFSYLR